MIGRYD